MAPEHPYPAGLDDAYAAVCWAVKNATQFESDSSLISVGGDGAGGNLAAAVALLAKDKGTQMVVVTDIYSIPGLPNGAKLLSQVIVASPLDLTPTANYESRQTNKSAFMLPLNQFQWFAAQYVGRNNDAASPYLRFQNYVESILI